jgi:hypothetical protein
MSHAVVHLLEGLAPAVAALLGVWIANRHSDKQLAAQLRDAAVQATRAREFGVRRDVYLDAAEAVVTGNSMVGGMLDITISDADIREGVNKTMGKLAKINVVGHVSTLRAVADYTSTLTDAVLALWLPRAQIQGAERTIKQLQTQLDSHSADEARWIEMMKQNNVQAAAGKREPQVMQMLQRQFALAKERFQATAQRQLAATALKRKIHGDSLNMQVGWLRKLQSLLPAALTAARAEMELRVDAAEVSAIFEQVAQRAEAATRRVLADAERLVAAQQQQEAPPPVPPTPPDSDAAPPADASSAQP